jgi:hypothetical protein
MNIRGDESFSDLFGKESRRFLESLDLGQYFNFNLKQYLSVLDSLEKKLEETSTELK